MTCCQWYALAYFCVFFCLFNCWQLIEYNDINDNAQLTSVDQSKEDLWNIRDFTEFEWMNVTLGETGNSIIFNSSRPQLAPYQNSTRGYVMFEVRSTQYLVNTCQGHIDRQGGTGRVLFVCQGHIDRQGGTGRVLIVCQSHIDRQGGTCLHCRSVWNIYLYKLVQRDPVWLTLRTGC